jgi:hypothetical protein
MAIGCQQSAISGWFSALSESRIDANLSDSADFLLAISRQSLAASFQRTFVNHEGLTCQSSLLKADGFRQLTANFLFHNTTALNQVRYRQKKRVFV